MQYKTGTTLALLFIIAILGFGGFSFAQTSNFWFPNSSDNLQPVDNNWGLTVVDLASCTQGLSTDSSGNFECNATGTGSGGGGITTDGNWIYNIPGDYLTTNTSTTGLIVNASSTFTSTARINSTLILPSITSKCLETDANGNVVAASGLCGTSSADGASNWQAAFLNALTPTSTTSGIYVRASSTFDSTLRVNGNTTINANLTVNGAVNGTTLNIGSSAVTADSTGLQVLTTTDALKIGAVGNQMRFTSGGAAWFIDDKNDVARITYNYASDLLTLTATNYSFPGTGSLNLGMVVTFVRTVLDQRIKVYNSGTASVAHSAGINFDLWDIDGAAQRTFGDLYMIRDATNLDAGSMVFKYSNTSGTLTEGMRLRFNGSLGVATSTPGGYFGEKLTVVGNSYFQGNVTSTNLTITSGASYAGHAVCNLATGKFGHCTSAVDSSGQCTCVEN